ncbi:MAG TPA: CusA/CzcA family heavy metal efflux RND transporter [Vicinamibacterales bacterium]|nr:CusA/CzcA family heavy metal efflux RND transporter [Vicinamibacterales bacterium]
MINRLVDLSLKYRGLVLAIYAGLAVAGYLALRSSAIDALPDLSDNQVIVFTDWTGHSAQEVEDQVTYPLTVNLQGLAGVRVVRSQSAFGFSMIYAVFEDDVDLYFARARVLERLGLVTKLLPSGVIPTLGPDATGVGHVFWYTVESDTLSLRELRTLQDWFIRYQLNAVPGVAEVASVGGTVQQYQIDLDPNRLRSYGLSIGEIVEAVRRSNSNVGGNVVEANGAWTIVRGLGLIRSVEDIQQIMVRERGGVPIFVSQVAEVRIGDAFRVASLVKGTHEAVGGVVVARANVNTNDVIDAIKARVRQIEPGLPAGVRIVPFYDRSELIERTVATLRFALIEEVALVTLAHILFLWHFRSFLIVTLPLPLAVLMSFLAMKGLDTSSNLMSLSGIAIAIGVLVDAGIVVTENAFRHMERNGVDPRDRKRALEAIREATKTVARPVFFSMLIIGLAFAPVFALTGQEGKLFHPLAFTKTFAVLAATLIAVTLVPVLCALLLRGRLHAEDANPVMRLLKRAYAPLLRRALARPALTLSLAGLTLVGSLALATRIGSEFMPPLNEGDLLFMPIADPSVSLEENTRIARTQNAALLTFPEVASVVAKVARAETSTDPSPLNMTETIVKLKPREQWRPGMTLAQLRTEMTKAVELPGVSTIWTMPIVNRIDMLTTGIRSEVGVKIFGSDLAVLDGLGRRVADILRTIRGAANVYPEPVTSGQYLNIRVDRAAAARYGLNVSSVQEVVEQAIGETVVGATIEGRQRFPIRVRYAAPYRSDPQSIGDAMVMGPGGQQVPLRSVTSIEPARGPAMISSENGLIVATVLLNVQERDAGSFIDEARRVVTERIALPAGYYLGWSGRYENQEHARRRLMLVFPIVLVVIFILLYFTYHSAAEAAHVLLAVPFALTGGVVLVWLLGYNFSVAVWVGFIALFGTAVQTAVVMVIYLDEAVARRRTADGGRLTRTSLREAVIDGALLRLRPKVMTVSTVVAGLLPIMWSTRVGAEVMKPIAAPVLGGMVSSLLHVLLVTPVIFFWLRARELGSDAERQDAPELTSPATLPQHRRRTRIWIGLAVLVVAGILIAATMWRLSGTGSTASPIAGHTIQELHSGSIVVALKSERSALHQGRNVFWIEFRSAAGTLIDVGDVRLAGAMTMPGMTMSGGAEVQRTSIDGRYQATAEFGMSGAWRFSLDWNGPAGAGSISFNGDVR